MRTSWFCFLLFCVCAGSVELVAQVPSADEALEFLETLQARKGCLDVGDCTGPFTPPSEELRDAIQSMHEPQFERIIDLPSTRPEATIAEAVCAVLPESHVVSDGKWSYIAATRPEYTALWGFEDEWCLVDASTGLLVEYSEPDGYSRHGVLTVAHTSTPADVCEGDVGLVFVFGLQSYEHVEREGNDYVRVPTEHVVRPSCAQLFLRTNLTDSAFYAVESDIAESFEPYGGSLVPVLPGASVSSIGFPQGLAMRVTSGEVDADLASESERTYPTNLYAQNGMSGAPVFLDGNLAGVHLASWAVRSDPADCLACPVPCDVRTLESGTDATPEPDCTEAGSWSTEAGYPQLLTLFDLPVIERLESVVAEYTRVRVEGGALFVRLDPRRVLAPIPDSEVLLARGQTIRVFLPPGSRVGVLGRRSDDDKFSWRYVTAEQYRKERGFSLVQQMHPRRLSISDRSVGRHDFAIGRADELR